MFIEQIRKTQIKNRVDPIYNVIFAMDTNTNFRISLSFHPDVVDLLYYKQRVMYRVNFL